MAKAAKGFLLHSDSGGEYYYNDETGFIVPGILRNEAVLHGERPVPPSTISGRDIRDYLIGAKAGFKELILEMTQGCNLRCKYCCYGDHYALHRPHGSGLMDWNTAKQAIDMYFGYFECIASGQPFANPTIGFYGGEPLLNFSLLKEVVAYTEKYQESMGPVEYTMTTNGLLLDEDSIDFLIQHNFSIIISLDGNKENHDRNRVTVQGMPTFDRVFERIRYIQTRYPEYHKFGISSCFDCRTDLMAFNSFVEDNHLFVINLSEVDRTNSTYHEQFSTDEETRFFRDYHNLKMRFREKVIAGEFSQHDRNLMLPLFANSYLLAACHTLGDMNRPSFLPYSGSCVPGQKIYVTLDGKLHMCEKTNPAFPIGDVENGLDFDRIAELLECFNQSLGRCRECGFTKLCSLCIGKANDGKTMGPPPGFCAQEKAGLQRVLSDYLSIVEANPAGFDRFIFPYLVLRRSLWNCLF